MKKKTVTITLNGKKMAVDPESTVLQVAHKKGVDIPSLCGHADFGCKANCRVCVVEIKGHRDLVTSCSTKVESGMIISTESERVVKSRNMNLELIFAEHIEKCAECIWRFECKLLKYANKYKILLTFFNDRKGKRKTYRFANSVELDGTQCIDCRNCIDACAMQGINYLEIKGKGLDQEIVPTKDEKKHCILCGQCAVHCPVSAAQEQAEWKEVEKEINNKERIVVAQVAPSIRVSIGEDFGLPYGKVMTDHVVAGLRELGFDYVFDVNFAADITTIVEAEELVERIAEGGTMPMFTACCPAWVNYVEHYRPDLIPNLTSARPPQIHGGGAIKTYWANKMGIDPKKIVVVSIMPCTAKKYEASRKEMAIDGHQPVDYALTTREFSFLMKKKMIDFPNIKKSKADNPMGVASGGGAIFGGTGGVMESALRTANLILAGDKDGIGKKRIDFKKVRGMAGIREAVIDIAGNKLRVAVVNGIGNIKYILDRLDKFDYIEVMSCPGGCIGGGGQPIPTNNEIRKKRIAALYSIDTKSKVRISGENPNAVMITDWMKKNSKKKSTLHTKYNKKTKY
jgi:iron-only hydrogenase group A